MTVTGDDALVGRVLDDRYLISSRIARGGMASVFLATDQRLDRDVALKVMHAHMSDDTDGDFTHRFVREARAAAKLNHRNVVSVFDQGYDGDITYLVMEFVPGRTLRDVMRDEAPMPPLRTVQLIEQVLIALSAAHSAKIIHRDVKPENVLITPEGEVKVADFGLARAVSAATTATGGTLIGTVSYLAPEIVLHEGADARSDVYAVGAMMYEMLTGVKPHTGESPIQVAYKHVHEDIAPPSERSPELPDYVDALIARATVRDRDQRSTDARVLLQQVRAVRRALEAGVASDPELVGDLAPRLTTDDAPIDRGSAISRADESEETVAVAVGAAALGGAAAGIAASEDDADAALNPDATGAYALDGTPQDAASAEHTVAWTDQHPAAAGTAVAPAVRDNRAATGLHPPMTQEDYRAMRAEQSSPRRGKIMLIAAVIAALLLGFGGWWFADGRYTDAPTLVGSAEAEAKTDAENAGFTFKVAERRYSETVAAGVVMSTDPDAGGKILPGGTIEAVVSKGKDRVTVPDNLSGMTLERATAALEKVDLVVGKTVEKYDEKVEKDRVIEAVSIKIDDQLKRGTTVDLAISKGKKPINIKDFTGSPFSGAKAAAEKNGLKVAATEEFSDDVKKGVVISQDPKDGTLYKGETISFVVSKGKDEVKVPNVVGKTRVEAGKILRDRGFKISVFSVPGNWTVREQSPDAGKKVKRGSTVGISPIGF